MNTEQIYEAGLGKNQANYTPLSPLTFIERAASVYPDYVSVVHGETRFTWAETYARCRRLASALRSRGIGKNDTVSVMLPNIPAMYEAHFGVGMAGAVLNALNYRLDADAIAFMLDHGEAEVLITDREFSPVIKEAIAKSGRDLVVIDVDDPLYEGGELVGETDYESFLLEGDPDFDWSLPPDEWGRDRAVLYLRHHGQPQGSGDPSSRGLPQCDFQPARMEYQRPSRLPVDPAHVSLQRLVLSLGYRRRDRDQRLPPGSPGR